MKQSRPVFAQIIETRLGSLGLAWTEEGLLALQLPESTLLKTRVALVKKVQALGYEKPVLVKKAHASIARLSKKLQLHFNGKAQDFSETPLSLGGLTPFFTSVYRFCFEQVPSGTTITYGGLAKAIGKPNSARAVGLAMARNPVPIVVPCHRVLASGSKKVKIGGFTAPGGILTKQRILALEGVKIIN
jgi:methylated-DNA-[protein]-cysteine S-methyltransferase